MKKKRKLLILNKLKQSWLNRKNKKTTKRLSKLKKKLKLMKKILSSKTKEKVQSSIRD